MKYYQIEELAVKFEVSTRTIYRRLKPLIDTDIDGLTKTVTDVNGRKRVVYAEALIKKLGHNNGVIDSDLSQVSEVSNGVNTSDLSNDYTEKYTSSLLEQIAYLKESLGTKDEQIKDYSSQFNSFQAIELQAMERIKEQNHIIHQLQIVSEERQQKLNAFLNKEEKQQKTYTVDAEDVVEETEQTEHDFTEEVVIEDVVEPIVEAPEVEENNAKTFNDFLNRYK